MVNTIPENPAAKIIIDGLFAFCLNPKKRQMELGVYEFADEHVFSLRITKRMRETDELVGETWEIKPPRGSGHLQNISIKVKNRPSDLEVYQNGSLGEEVFQSDPTTLGDINPEDDEVKHDFRWVIDLEGMRYHNRKLDMTPGTLTRRIRIPNGVVSTHEIGPREVKSAFPEAARLANRALAFKRCYVASQMAVDLVADSAEEQVVIAYNAGAPDKRNRLTLTPADDFYYEILLHNNCQRDGNTDKHFSDFQHYYNVFADVAADERIDFAPFAKGTGDKTSPCDLIFLGQHEEL
ncbi:MAG: hypothetical protein HYR56_21375 [Acidobacteria bacterium]|nr:hypothetical protein [Acidobacteriota bacterium]MBI3427639.1 hypothetical protein [Acidobacteriota bacterium]